MLCEAAEAGDLARVRAALASGEDPDARDAHRSPALSLAVCQGHPEIARALLAAGATPDLKDADKETPLMHAVRRDDAALVEALLAAGADPRRVAYRSTALQLAVLEGRPAAAAALAPVTRLKGPAAALLQAVAAADLDAVRTALAAGAPVHGRDRALEWPALAWAASLGHEVIARCLLDAGADPQGEADGRPLWVLALAARSAPLTRVLLDAAGGPAAGQLDELLLAFAETGRAASIQILLELGADPNATRTTLRAQTAIYEAVRSGDAESVRILRQAGAAPDPRCGEYALSFEDPAQRDALLEALGA